jgi:putative aldouronate transport system permease protein
MSLATVKCKKYKYERSTLWKTIVSYKYYYLLIIVPILFYLIFAYTPMYGATLAFKQFRYDKGIFNSPWIGLENFRMMLKDRDFVSAFRNTFIISMMKIVICFPIPIVMALLMNEIFNSKIKRVFQTIFTFPHFLSWVVVAGILMNLLSSNGAYNQILHLLGLKSQSFLTGQQYFRWVLYLSVVWKEMGWSSIIYLAALAGINPGLYEAAEIDGANREQMAKYITWPCIRSTVAIVLILAVGSSMNDNFDQVFNLYNPSVYKTGDILDTYAYRVAFTVNTDFSLASAIGLCKSVISCLLVFGANFAVTRLFKEEGLF